MQSLDEHQIEHLLYKQNSQVFQVTEAMLKATTFMADSLETSYAISDNVGLSSFISKSTISGNAHSAIYECHNN